MIKASENIFSFYEKLSKLTLPQGSILLTLPSPEILKYGLEHGIPLLNLAPPEVEAEDFFALLEQIAGLMQEHFPDVIGECRHICAALPLEAPARKLFVAQAFRPGCNLLAHLRANVPPETFGFLLGHVLKIFMRHYAKTAAVCYNSDQWQKGICPTCGGKPGLALLERESRRRYLYCGLCETKWRFQRLGCPYCSNRESQYFVIEGQEKYRVYFCDQCRGYLKTVDESESATEVDLFWEGVNTMHLDILALQEGYTGFGHAWGASPPEA